MYVLLLARQEFYTFVKLISNGGLRAGGPFCHVHEMFQVSIDKQ